MAFEIKVPGDETRILLHSCCAPCSGAIIEYMTGHGMKPAVFFSNSNITPSEEYLLRRDECAGFCREMGVDFIEDEYNHDGWECVARGLEDRPERGERCLQCFRYRLERAARYASEHGFKVLTTTLASSRWKSLDQVDAAGEYACSLYPGVTWWSQNWRKGGLQERRNEIIRERGFYNQLFCGCEYSHR